LPVSVSHN